MRNGMYRVTYPDGRIKVLEVTLNGTEAGSVQLLKERGCIFEEVVILTPQEFVNHIRKTREEVLETVQHGGS